MDTKNKNIRVGKKRIMKNNLKVGDWVDCKGKEYQVAIVNEDGTVRLATDNVEHPSYYEGTIGCFSEGFLTKIEKK